MPDWIAERSPEPWRLQLRLASFRSAPFHVETGGKQSGRRVALHEFPKRDDPYAEDMGRRTRTWEITGYFIEGDRRLGWDYRQGRNRLIAALETEGPGMLIHPTLPEMMVMAERYSVIESRDRGGYCIFEMRFVEAGRPGNSISGYDTAGQVNTAATAASSASTSAFDSTMARYTSDPNAWPIGR